MTDGANIAFCRAVARAVQGSVRVSQAPLIPSSMPITSPQSDRKVSFRIAELFCCTGTA